MGIDIRLGQKMELRQVQLQLSPQLQLLQYIPDEFKPHVNIEEDDDVELLRRSIPFLALHEFSHPLYSQKKVDISLPPDADHDATETGIDKAAMLLGPRVGVSPEKMYSAHTAMMERVFRDYLELKRFEPNVSLLARFYCQIKEHHGQTREDILKKRLEQLISQAEKNASSFAGREVFERKVTSYAEIYRHTFLRF